MPVRKFRSFDEASRDLWLEPGDPAIVRRMDVVLGLVRYGRPIPFPRGVHRYRSAEDAEVASEAWIDENIRRLETDSASQVHDRPAKKDDES